MTPHRSPILRPRCRGSREQRRLCAECRRSRQLGAEAAISADQARAWAEGATPVDQIRADAEATTPRSQVEVEAEATTPANQVRAVAEAATAADQAETRKKSAGAAASPSAAVRPGAATAAAAAASTQPSESDAVVERLKMPRRRGPVTARGQAQLPATPGGSIPAELPSRSSPPPYVRSGAARQPLLSPSREVDACSRLATSPASSRPQPARGATTSTAYGQP